MATVGTTALKTQQPTLTLPSGDKMPAIGYGTWLSAKGEVYEGTKSALAAGYRHIDEAWVYMNEAEVGKAVSEALADGTIGSRSELWITSKLWNCFHRPELVRAILFLCDARDQKITLGSLFTAVEALIRLDEPSP